MTGEREAGTTPVALLAEGVDRNYNLYSVFLGHGVALLAEGVDRNNQDNTLADTLIRRPPRGGRG